VYALFIVLFAGTPILGVAFALSILGASFPRVYLQSRTKLLSRAELHALRLSAVDGARRYEGGAGSSPEAGPASGFCRGSWRMVLGLPLNEHRRSVAHRAYRALARAHHPDRSGSNAAMQRVNAAWKQAKRELVLK